MKTKDVLAAIADAGKALSVDDLASKLRADRAEVQQAVNESARKGWVKSSEGSYPGRGTTVFYYFSLTPEGETEAQRLAHLLAQRPSNPHG